MLGLRLLTGLSGLKRSHSSAIPLFDLGGPTKTRLDEGVCQLLLDMFENACVFPAADFGTVSISMRIAAAECVSEPNLAESVPVKNALLVK